MQQSEEELSSISDEDEIEKSQPTQNGEINHETSRGSSHYAPTFPDISLSTIRAEESTLVADVKSESYDTGADWLRRNVVVQYWCGHDAPEAADASNLHRDW